MSVLVQTTLNVTRLFSLRKAFSYPLTCTCIRKRKYLNNAAKKFASFDDVVSRRRAEARRSIVVQVNSESSFSELYGYCSKYASINGIHHYKNSGGEHFMLIEFASEDNLKDILQTCSAHMKEVDVMALKTPFLWFRAVPGQKKKLTAPTNVSLITREGTHVDEDKLFEDLLKCETVSDQIQLMYDRTTLNDLGARLRYIVARQDHIWSLKSGIGCRLKSSLDRFSSRAALRWLAGRMRPAGRIFDIPDKDFLLQLEVIFESLYRNVGILPFGSSVNGFGKNGCDLDLVLTNVLTEQMSDNTKRLVYCEKKCEGGRSPWQRHMELVGEILELRVPGATRVQRILNARVPIVKYAHELTGVDCDLCYNNMSGVYMSELLWLYGSLDLRVRPLTFVVRRWAQTVGLTNPHPGRWITNFPLTLMVIFFLQQKSKEGRILPSLKYLTNKASKEDIRIAEDNVNCTFLRDLNKLSPDSYSQNNASLETLLLQFFEFYSQFDFQEKAISINEGVAIRKPNSLPLYIVNPLEQGLNVSRNVSFEECERLKVEVRNAAWQLESGPDEPRGEDWGLLGLIEKRTTRGLKKLLRVGNSQRLVSVKDLFTDNEKEENENAIRSKLNKLSQKPQEEVEQSVKEMKDGFVKIEKKEHKMKFKNSQIASEVCRIRRNKMV